MDFKRYAYQLYISSEEHAKFLKGQLIVKKAIPLSDFFGTYESTVEKTLGDMPTTQQRPSLEKFSYAIEQLEKCPENLQKLKKPTYKEQTRSHSNMRIISTSTSHGGSGNIANIKEQSGGDTNKNTKDAKRIFLEFNDFVETLWKTKAAVGEHDIKTQNLAKTLEQLQIFNLNINHLLPADRLKVAAFEMQEDALGKLLLQLKQYNCIQENHHMFEATAYISTESSLQQVMDVLDTAYNNLL